MKKKLILIICLFYILIGVKAQQVIASNGNYFENNSGSISFTIGEIATELLGSGNYLLTQGMQQSKLTATAINNLQQIFDVNVYPNPTKSLITLAITDGNYQTARYELQTVQGVILLKGRFAFSTREISLEHLPKGLYLISVFDGKKRAIYKVVKQ